MDHKSLPKFGFVHSAILKALWSKPSLCVRKLRDRGLQICPVSTDCQWWEQGLSPAWAGMQQGRTGIPSFNLGLHLSLYFAQKCMSSRRMLVLEAAA